MTNQGVDDLVLISILVFHSNVKVPEGVCLLGAFRNLLEHGTESQTIIQSEHLEDDFTVENVVVDGFQLEFLSKHILSLCKTWGDDKRKRIPS